MDNNKDDIYIQGFKLSVENAKRLFDAAEVLAKTKEYPIANSLLILSAEEAAKAFYLFMQHHYPDMVEKKSLEKVFKDHDFKLEAIRQLSTMGIIMEAMSNILYVPVIKAIIKDKSDKEISQIKNDRVTNMKNWFEGAVKNKSHLSQTDMWWKHAEKLKEKGFYVELHRDKWSSPTTNVKKSTYTISKKYVEQIIKRIEGIYNHFDSDFMNEQIKEGKKIFAKYKKDIDQI
jgi:AbiV family abortive infection protein